jgi:hypothetical protein
MAKTSINRMQLRFDYSEVLQNHAISVYKKELEHPAWGMHRWHVAYHEAIKAGVVWLSFQDFYHLILHCKTYTAYLKELEHERQVREQREAEERRREAGLPRRRYARGSRCFSGPYRVGTKYVRHVDHEKKERNDAKLLWRIHKGIAKDKRNPNYSHGRRSRDLVKGERALRRFVRTKLRQGLYDAIDEKSLQSFTDPWNWS